MNETAVARAREMTRTSKEEKRADNESLLAIPTRYPDSRERIDPAHPAFYRHSRSRESVFLY